MKNTKSFLTFLLTICLVLLLLPWGSVNAAATIPPKAPSNLVGTFYPPNTALLTWKDNSNDELEFFLNISYKCPNSKGVYLSAQIVARVAKNSTSAKYTMQNGCTYNINVQASGAAKPGFYNLSAKSNSVTLIAPPLSPSNLTVKKGSTNYSFTFTDNSDNEGLFAAVIGYKGGFQVFAIPANLSSKQVTFAIPANALPSSAKAGVEIEVGALPASAIPANLKSGQALPSSILAYLAIPSNSIAKFMTNSLYLPRLFASNLVSVK